MLVLKRAQTARDMALKAGQSPAQVAKQFDEKTDQIELERSRSKELLGQKTALEQIGKQEQYNLQVVERSFDLYMRLADAYKSLITGTSVGAERARAAADQQANPLDVTVVPQRSPLSVNLGTLADDLGSFPFVHGP